MKQLEITVTWFCPRCHRRSVNTILRKHPPKCRKHKGELVFMIPYTEEAARKATKKTIAEIHRLLQDYATDEEVNEAEL